MNAFFNSIKMRNRGRRRGIAAVYVGLLLIILIGITSFSIDMAWLYSRQSVAQKAADAAALAGAWQLANFHTRAEADGNARYYAGLPENGCYANNTPTNCYPGPTPGVTPSPTAVVTVEFPAVNKEVTPNVTVPNWYRVKVSRQEPTFFAGIFGSAFRRVTVGASATALYETLAELDIKGGGVYGKAPGPVNLSLFGPDGFYNNGDCYSVKKLTDGSNNPLYNPNGYDFTIDLDQFRANGKTTAYFQIFDPDCYNATSGSVNGVSAVDEYRDSAGNASSVSNATTTLYSLYDDNGTPYNYADDKLLKADSYDGTDTATDLIWNDFFSQPMSTLGDHNLRLRVQSTAGASENGFDLRVSDQPALKRSLQVGGTDNFNASNGSKITAQGHMPMNFNKDGTVNITLGTIPIEAAGGQLSIRKFDTDIGAKTIIYKCSTLPNQQWTGTLSGNGTFATDTISVPSTYTTAGVWTATYAAGTGDTSVWDMSYSNSGPGKPGGIKLVQ